MSAHFLKFHQKTCELLDDTLMKLEEIRIIEDGETVKKYDLISKTVRKVTKKINNQFVILTAGIASNQATRTDDVGQHKITTTQKDIDVRDLNASLMKPDDAEPGTSKALVGQLSKQQRPLGFKTNSKPKLRGSSKTTAVNSVKFRQTVWLGPTIQPTNKFKSVKKSM